jgi:membrane-associated protein
MKGRIYFDETKRDACWSLTKEVRVMKKYVKYWVGVLVVVLAGVGVMLAGAAEKTAAIKHFVGYFLHIDKYLAQVISDYGLWTYGVLFTIIFCETGLVVLPFLPGDSLLFAAGALSVTTPIQVGWLLGLLIAAAIIGDAVNYMIGYYAGEKILQLKSRFIKKKHLDRTHEFFEKNGKMTIVLARFVPIIRTFAPFVAGLGKMKYTEFAVYNITGGCLWVSLFVLGGRYFGNLEIVKKNFSLVIVAIIILSVLPIAYEVWRQWMDGKRKELPEPKE